jgi:hypothetical protein
LGQGSYGAPALRFALVLWGKVSLR